MPTTAVDEAKRCLIDGFGVVLAGATVHGSAIVREHIKAAGAHSGSTILGPEKIVATAAHAALANAAIGHAMDYDDTQLSTTPDRVFGLLTHPTVPVLAAALALGERLNVSGRTFLEAFLIGFEVECKVAEAIKPDHYLRGFHSTGTIGTFGAVASAARLLKLSPVQLTHALGIAASLNSGIRVNFGSMTKPLHAGRAAENGVTAAELASRGFTAGDEPLDGEWGFFQVLGGGADVPRIVAVLGNPFSIVNPGVSVKPYPCGSLGQPTMDAMLKLVTDQQIEARGFDKMRSIVEVDLVDGRKLSQPSDERYRGAPEKPFTRAELHGKFTDCASLVLSGDRITRALDAIESVDRLASVRELVAALG